MPKPKRRSRQTNAYLQESAETALLVVDQQPFLKKALSTCKRLRKELHKKQKLLADFEERDRSAYQQWYHGKHGVELTQIREARDEVSEYEFIIYHLNNAARLDYESVPPLYKELMQRKKDGTLHGYEPPEPEAGADDIFGDDDDDEWDEAFDDVFGRGSQAGDEDWGEEEGKRFFEDMFGSGSGSGGFSTPHGSQAKPRDDARLKTCYRNLAKRLHPDHSELEESIREKRWHEIQDAYHRGDLEALLRVEAICDMDATGLTLKLGLARLRDLAAYHQSHLIPLRDALRVAKHDIAFGFAENGASRTIQWEVEVRLRHERQVLDEQLRYFKRAVKGFYDEVRAEIREDEARAMRAKRQAERDAPKPEKPKAAPAAKPAPAANAAPAKEKPKPAKEPVGDARQMSFF